MRPTFCFGAMLAMSQPAGRLSPAFTFAPAAALSRVASSAASSPGCNTHHIWLQFAFPIVSTDDDTVLWQCGESAAAFSCVAGSAASSPGCRGLARSPQILWIADYFVGCLRRHVFVRRQRRCQAAGSSPSFKVSFVFHQLRKLDPRVPSDFASAATSSAGSPGTSGPLYVLASTCDGHLLRIMHVGSGAAYSPPASSAARCPGCQDGGAAFRILDPRTCRHRQSSCIHISAATFMLARRGRSPAGPGVWRAPAAATPPS